MAGTIIADTIQTENTFLQLNVSNTRVATINASGIFSNTGTKMIGTDGSIAANVSSITANLTLTGNLSVDATGTTGIRAPAANTLAFYEGGVEAMRIDSSGNVGIGTSSPTGKLDVSSSSAGVTAGDLVVDTANKTVYVGRQSSTGGDNSYLIVRGRLNANGTNQAVVITGDTTAYGTGLFRPGNDILGFSTLATERMRITSAGYVKASDSGTYLSSSGTYHEFRNTLSDPSIFATATNASYGSNAIIIDVTRSATSGYNFALIRSGASGSQDNEFVLRGDGNGYADGTWNNNGADYAEYFESATGQAIPVGSTVVLENNKVRLATESDNPSDIIGVVRPKEPSKASMVVGNTAWNKWANKYLTDDFDRYIMEDHNVVEWTDSSGKKHSYESHNISEDVIVPENAIVKTHDDEGNKFQHYKLNPAWNKDSEYINRENRDEWLIIGLVGQVKVLKEQIMGERWKKMRNVSASVEEWFIR